MNHILRRAVVIFFVVLGVTSCAGLSGSTKSGAQLDPKDEVAALASARWQALIKGDLAKAYEYMGPGSRAAMSLDLYKAKIHPGRWKNAKVDSVSCEQSTCKVVMLIKYADRMVGVFETSLKETWLLENGKWWYVPLD